MVRIAKQKGYTLIEVMISLVILVGLIFTANFSYSLYIRYWDGRLGQFDRTVFYFQGMLQVKETIDSAVPYIVKRDKDFTFYFLGREQGFTLVSAAPIFAPTVNDAAVVRVFIEQKQNHYQLVYEEAPLSERLLIDIEQQLDFKYRTVLVRTEQPMSFAYYGWPSREHKFERTSYQNAEPLWSSTYDAAATRIQPQTIALTMGSEQMLFDLPVGHDRLINFYLDEGSR